MLSRRLQKQLLQTIVEREEQKTARRLPWHRTGLWLPKTCSEEAVMPSLGLQATRLAETRSKAQRPISELMFCAATRRDAGFIKPNWQCLRIGVRCRDILDYTPLDLFANQTKFVMSQQWKISLTSISHLEIVFHNFYSLRGLLIYEGMLPQVRFHKIKRTKKLSYE